MSALQLESGETLSTRLQVHSLADTLRDTHLDAGCARLLLVATRDALQQLGVYEYYTVLYSSVLSEYTRCGLLYPLLVHKYRVLFTISRKVLCMYRYISV